MRVPIAFTILLVISSFALSPKDPHIVVRDGASGRLIDLQNGVRGSGPFVFRLTATTSETGEIPNDNPFRITLGTVILVRGTQQVATIVMKDELADTTPWVSLIKPGDRIVVSVREVVKLSSGKREKVMMAPVIINIPVG